nr:NADH dehydrogenase subunit 4 [Henestaris halophilus]
MMKFFMMTLFMVLLLSNWWLIMISVMIMLFLFIMNNVSSYLSSLSYGYGFDTVSFCLISLSIWIISLMIMTSSKLMNINGSEFLFVMIMMLMFLMLIFSCSNLFILYIWFESVMIPTLILIFGWGYQPERLMAGLYLLFYTMFASLPMLVCLFYVFYINHSLFFFLIDIDINIYLYLSLIMAFLISMPMFFVHFWLPSAHVEAPISGSMILAGILLKMGGYGLYRVLFFLYKYNLYNYVIILISMLGSFLVGIMCLCQVDIKSLIAYSSVSHMGLVISGLMSCNFCGLYGSLILMIGHGLCSSGMFVLANFIYERSHSRSFLINSGYMSLMPSMALMWFMISVNNMSSPPSLNLFGEILLIKSIMSWSLMMMIFLMLSSFFSCCYSIYLYSITQHGSSYTYNKFQANNCVREYMLMLFHIVPLNLLFLKSEMFYIY